MAEELFQSIEEIDGKLFEVVFEFFEASLEGRGGFVCSFVRFSKGNFGAQIDDGSSNLEDFAIFPDKVVNLLLLGGVVAEDASKEGLLLAFLISILLEESLDGHQFLIEHRHLLVECINVYVFVFLTHLSIKLGQHIEIQLEQSALLMIE